MVMGDIRSYLLLEIEVYHSDENNTWLNCQKKCFLTLLILRPKILLIIGEQKTTKTNYYGKCNNFFGI